MYSLTVVEHLDVAQSSAPSNRRRKAVAVLDNLGERFAWLFGGRIMRDNARAVVGGGGVWANAPLDAPWHPEAESGADFKIILPGGTQRADVLAPAQSPWNAIGLLNLSHHGQSVVVGTGFLCEPDVLITAKHNLVSTPFDAAGVWMAYDAQRNGTVPAVSIIAWAVHRTLDLGILILGAPQAAGGFALGGTSLAPHTTVTLAGYAMPYANGSARYSYAQGVVTAVDVTQLSYLINTREGDSGAPVFVVANGIPMAVGVHTEAAIAPTLGNTGVLITPAVASDFSILIAWARTQVGAQS